MGREMSTIYGPVPSWRLGKSLGVDLITKDKVCSFDCVYCQLGCTKEQSVKRAIFVDTELVKLDLSEALEALEEGDVDIITFSGMGESTLASNLDEAIEVVRAITDLPIAILTNASLLHLKEVQICRENGVEIAGKIPFDVSITKAMVAGVPVVETEPKTDEGEAIERMWARINQSNCLTTKSPDV